MKNWYARKSTAQLVQHISERTVGSHVDHIMTKLGIRSRTRVAVWAVEHGLGGSPTD